jgi:hypothetical protein
LVARDESLFHQSYGLERLVQIWAQEPEFQVSQHWSILCSFKGFPLLPHDTAGSLQKDQIIQIFPWVPFLFKSTPSHKQCFCTLNPWLIFRLSILNPALYDQVFINQCQEPSSDMRCCNSIISTGCAAQHYWILWTQYLAFRLKVQSLAVFVPPSEAVSVILLHVVWPVDWWHYVAIKFWSSLHQVVQTILVILYAITRLRLEHDLKQNSFATWHI